jgi:hypothetical protein
VTLCSPKLIKEKEKLDTSIEPVKTFGLLKFTFILQACLEVRTISIVGWLMDGCPCFWANQNLPSFISFLLPMTFMYFDSLSMLCITAWITGQVGRDTPGYTRRPTQTRYLIYLEDKAYHDILRNQICMIDFLVMN